jgi:hypothetical protein
VQPLDQRPAAPGPPPKPNPCPPAHPLAPTLQAGARLCKALGPEFLPYLGVVMPPLLKTAALEPDVKVRGGGRRCLGQGGGALAGAAAAALPAGAAWGCASPAPAPTPAFFAPPHPSRSRMPRMWTTTRRTTTWSTSTLGTSWWVAVGGGGCGAAGGAQAGAAWRGPWRSWHTEVQAAPGDCPHGSGKPAPPPTHTHPHPPTQPQPFSSPPTPAQVAIRTSTLEEKATACSMIGCYVDELKEGFFPYVKQVWVGAAEGGVGEGAAGGQVRAPRQGARSGREGERQASAAP